jgi:hypothetical protein
MKFRDESDSIYKFKCRRNKKTLNSFSKTFIKMFNVFNDLTMDFLENIQLLHMHRIKACLTLSYLFLMKNFLNFLKISEK